MTSPIITASHVYKAYDTHMVLRDVNLTVQPHEVVTLIGASGCGKSTLLRCINALEPTQHGSITVDGEHVSASRKGIDAVRSKVGLVFQSYNLFPHLSVLQNIVLAPRRVRKSTRAEATDTAMRLLARFDLEHKAHEYPDRLSGGQQQRVAIIRALAMSPTVLLLDEVTSALDPETVGEVLMLIRELKDASMTMVLATHEMGFAREVADRVVYMHDGRVLEEGTPEQIFTAPRHARTAQFLDRVLQPERS